MASLKRNNYLITALYVQGEGTVITEVTYVQCVCECEVMILMKNNNNNNKSELYDMQKYC